MGRIYKLDETDLYNDPRESPFLDKVGPHARIEKIYGLWEWLVTAKDKGMDSRHLENFQQFIKKLYRKDSVPLSYSILDTMATL